MSRAFLTSYAILAVFSSAAAAAAQPVSTDTNVIPGDPNTNYRVAVSLFHGRGVSADNEYLLQGIPLLLVQIVSELRNHHFGRSERSAYQRHILESAIAQERERIDGLFQARSSILFQSADPRTALKNSTESIEASERRLRFLKGVDPAGISVEDDKPIVLVQGLDGKQLISFPAVSPAQTAKELHLDLLIWGSVDQVEDHLIVHVSIFDSAMGRSLYDYTRSLSPSTVMSSASQVADQLVKSVLGREFGNLSLETFPVSAMVYVDGKFYGIGGISIPYMTIGVHRLEVRAPGYAPKTITVKISAFRDTKADVRLDAVPRPEVVVSSTPAGADVYVASEWKGKTPIILPIPTGSEALILRMAGYHTYTATITPSTPLQLHLQLLPDIFKYQDYVAGLRNRFYFSFGAFALSVIAPVGFYSLMRDYLVKLQTTTNLQEAERLKNQASVWYYAYLGGVFISSALFTNMVIDISDYLGAIH